MAEHVNSTITDAVTQANVQVLGTSPAMALSNIYQAFSQSLALAAGNAVTAQQQANVIHQVTTTIGVSTLYGVELGAAGRALRSVARGGK